MPQTPTITIQLVHIQGPLKGQVSEFSKFPIHIGRHAACQIRYDKEMTAISRKHARIECKGNRFRIIDVSTNGTYINGKRIADVYLRDGDVITFSENGPKASFLTKIGVGSAQIPPPQSEAPHLKLPDAASVQSSESHMTLGGDQDIEVFRIEAPLVIQYGNELKKFNILPIIIGSASDCDVIITNANLNHHHVQIFFSADNYHAKDLTGECKASINGRPIETQSVLAQGAELSLSDQGPKFRFLGDGRLAQIQEPKKPQVRKNRLFRKCSQYQQKHRCDKNFLKPFCIVFEKRRHLRAFRRYAKNR